MSWYVLVIFLQLYTLFIWWCVRAKHLELLAFWFSFAAMRYNDIQCTIPLCKEKCFLRAGWIGLKVMAGCGRNVGDDFVQVSRGREAAKMGWQDEEAGCRGQLPSKSASTWPGRAWKAWKHYHQVQPTVTAQVSVNFWLHVDLNLLFWSV